MFQNSFVIAKRGFLLLMVSSKLTELKKAFSPEEAADYVSKKLHESVSVAEILSATLDGHVSVSLLLKANTACLSGQIQAASELENSFSLDFKDKQICFDRVPTLKRGSFSLRLEGSEIKDLARLYESYAGKSYSGDLPKQEFQAVVLWEGDHIYLPLDEFYPLAEIDNLSEPFEIRVEARRFIQESLRGSLVVPLKDPAVLERDFERKVSETDYFLLDRMSYCLNDQWPKESEFIYTKQNLDDFISVVYGDEGSRDAQVSDVVQKEINPKEKNTLLVLLAAMAKEANFDLDERGIAGAIQRLTEEFGTPITDDTIRKIIKEIPEAVEMRKK